MKSLYITTIITLGWATSSQAQMLPDSGNRTGGKAYVKVDKLAELMANSSERGVTTPVACDENYSSYAACYQFTPSNSELIGRCFKAGETSFYGHPPGSEKLLTRDPEYGTVYLKELTPVSEAEQTEGFQSGSRKRVEGDWQEVVIGTEINCAPKASTRPFVLDRVTASIPLDIPITYDLKGNTHRNCLLAEKSLSSTSLTYGYDKTQFYCLESETTDEAEVIAESYIQAFKQADQDRFYAAGSWRHLRGQELAYTGLTQADVRILTKSPEEIRAFYAELGVEAEIAAGRAAVLFAIDVIFEK